MIAINFPPPPTDAQFSFRTLCNYVSGFAWCIRSDFGNDFAAGAASALQPYVRKALSQPVAVLTTAQEQSLVRGWSTETLLRQPLAQTELIFPAVHWAPVQAYYSVHGTSSVWVPSGGAGALTHANHLRALSSQLAPSSLPTAVRLNGVSAEPACVVGIPGQTGAQPLPPLQTLSAPAASNCVEFAGHGLIYARRRQLEDRRGTWLRENKRKRLPKGQLAALDKATHATTVYDFLYRLRLRANYDDVEAFLSGGLSSGDPQRFIEDLTTLVAFLNFVAEFNVAAKVGNTVLDRLIPTSAFSTAGEAGQCLANRKSAWPRP